MTIIDIEAVDEERVYRERSSAGALRQAAVVMVSTNPKGDLRNKKISKRYDQQKKIMCCDELAVKSTRKFPLISIVTKENQYD